MNERSLLDAGRIVRAGLNDLGSSLIWAAFLVACATVLSGC